MFKNQHIRRKLMMVIILTSGIVLVLTCAAFFIYEYYSFKKSLVDETESLGKMCAANCTAALAFENRRDARQVLSTLSMNTNISAAILFDNNDSVFAYYPASIDLKQVIPKTLSSGFRFDDNHLTGVLAVSENNMRLGTLYLVADMSKMFQRFQLYGLIVIAVLMISLLVAFILSSILQRNISDPILSLAATSKLISVNRDYSVRAIKSDDDEIGQLTDAFNQMLGEIQEQNFSITQLNQNLEQKVHERTNELELAYREMEAFTYTVSHDLNAPLRRIDLFIEMYVAKKQEVEADCRITLEKISSNTQRMRQLIKDLLTFSKTGRQELVKKDVDMKAMANEVFEEMSKLEADRPIDFRINDLPFANVDESTMKQVWINLISNAIKYSKERPVAEISVGFQETESTIVYCVEDNGVGFDDQDAQRLFTPFQRLHMQADFEGTGIGLAIVHRIVSRHGGEVWANGRPGEGASFFFSIPKV